MGVSAIVVEVIAAVGKKGPYNKGEGKKGVQGKTKQAGKNNDGKGNKGKHDVEDRPGKGGEPRLCFKRGQADHFKRDCPSMAPARVAAVQGRRLASRMAI